MKIEFESLKEMREFLAELNVVADPAPVDTAQTNATQVATPVQTEVQTMQPSAMPTAQPASVQLNTPPVQSIPAQAPAQPAVATSAPTYTLDDLARAGMSLMDSGRQGVLLQLLNQFGIQALPALPPEKYGAFATALREMGAQI